MNALWDKSMSKKMGLSEMRIMRCTSGNTLRDWMKNDCTCMKSQCAPIEDKLWEAYMCGNQES